LAQRRDALVAHLPQAAATRYQKLVSRGVELPIAAIDAGACGGCGAILRPMRSKNVCVCSSCGRLLITAPRHVKGHA
jgi:predicted  nucleic acid-binding Zn-ribbon protein